MDVLDDADIIRAISHAKQLLALIDTFPITNPTSTPTTTSTSSNPQLGTLGTEGHSIETPCPSTTTDASGSEPDLILLLSSIRARYKLLCSSLGVRPRLVAAAGKDGSLGAGGDDEENGDVQVVVSEGVVQGIEGPMKGVDTRMLRY